MTDVLAVRLYEQCKLELIVTSPTRGFIYDAANGMWWEHKDIKTFVNDLVLRCFTDSEYVGKHPSYSQRREIAQKVLQHFTAARFPGANGTAWPLRKGQCLDLHTLVPRQSTPTDYFTHICGTRWDSTVDITYVKAYLARMHPKLHVYLATALVPWTKHMTVELYGSRSGLSTCFEIVNTLFHNLVWVPSNLDTLAPITWGAPDNRHLVLTNHLTRPRLLVVADTPTYEKLAQVVNYIRDTLDPVTIFVPTHKRLSVDDDRMCCLHLATLPQEVVDPDFIEHFTPHYPALFRYLAETAHELLCGTLDGEITRRGLVRC